MWEWGLKLEFVYNLKISVFFYFIYNLVFGICSKREGFVFLLCIVND